MASICMQWHVVPGTSSLVFTTGAQLRLLTLQPALQTALQIHATRRHCSVCRLTSQRTRSRTRVSWTATRSQDWQQTPSPAAATRSHYLSAVAPSSCAAAFCRRTPTVRGVIGRGVTACTAENLRKGPFTVVYCQHEAAAQWCHLLQHASIQCCACGRQAPCHTLGIMPTRMTICAAGVHCTSNSKNSPSSRA